MAANATRAPPQANSDHTNTIWRSITRDAPFALIIPRTMPTPVAELGPGLVNWLPGQVQVFIHGEAQTVMHNLRPYIRKERGVDAKWASSISGYWRRGRTEVDPLLAAYATFASLALIASLLHLGLFDPHRVVDHATGWLAACGTTKAAPLEVTYFYLPG